MNKAKVKLSAEELSLVLNEHFILTKQNIINKVYTLFGEVSEIYKDCVNQNESIFGDEILKNAPRISKGENYNQMPWVMLDYPRYFNSSDVFAVRSFFWWGNFFSITLHLSGKFKKQFEENIFSITKNHKCLDEWYIFVSDLEWQHTINKKTHQKLDTFLKKDKNISLMKQKSFMKISKKISLNNWDNVFEFLENSFKEVLSILITQPM